MGGALCVVVVGLLYSRLAWTSVDGPDKRFSELETTLAVMMPFAFAHFIKLGIALYLCAFPFGVALQVLEFTCSLTLTYT